MEKTYLSSINLKENGECKDTFSQERKYNPPWRARYHTCSFCKREFKSAQALGGHMNVHRRERARLRELQSSWFLDHSSSNPKLSFPSSSSSVNFAACSMTNKDFLISSTKSDLIISHHQEKKPVVMDCAKHDLSISHQQEKKPAVMDCALHDFLEHRHQKLGSETTFVGVHNHKYCASDEVELLKKDNPFVTLDFIVSLHDQDSADNLDLELRLGCP